MISKVCADINVLDKGVLPLHRDSVALQLYVDIENKSRAQSCKVFFSIKRCCLVDENQEDCGIFDIYGGYFGIIRPKERHTIILVHPTVYPHDKIGSCEVVLNFKCDTNCIKKRKVLIPFDTSIFNCKKKRRNKKIFENYFNPRDIEYCASKDNNPLEDCAIVNCDMKYNEYKHYYDTRESKCVKAPACVGNYTDDAFNVVYVPKSNACRDLSESITLDDIYAIKTGLGVVMEDQETETADKIILRTNMTTISQNLKFLKDIFYGKYLRSDAEDYSKYTFAAVGSIIAYIVGVAALVLSFFCCLQTCLWFHDKWSANENFRDCCSDLKKRFKSLTSKVSSTQERVSPEVKNTLLREIIVRDIPLELRDSVVDICDRMNAQVKWKRRYRLDDLGSQISLYAPETDEESHIAFSSTESFVEKETVLD